MKRNAFPQLPADVQEAVVAAIREAEARTTGEIRVYVEKRCEYMNALDRAVEIFGQLNMQQTEQRNAILIYLAMADRQFALFGDEAIYRQAGGAAFWQDAAAQLQQRLRAGDPAGGLVSCIQRLGDSLATAFPPVPGIEKNELPDEIVFGQ
jgi:uncharacterized membrane protein